MNSKYVGNNNDTKCEECSSKAEFKKFQLRMGIIIHCKGSKKRIIPAFYLENTHFF